MSFYFQPPVFAVQPQPQPQPQVMVVYPNRYRVTYIPQPLPVYYVAFVPSPAPAQTPAIVYELQAETHLVPADAALLPLRLGPGVVLVASRVAPDPVARPRALQSVAASDPPPQAGDAAVAGEADAAAAG